MRIKLEMDEKWPVFTILSPEEHQNLRSIERCLAQEEFVEIPDEMATKYIKIQQEYNAMQKQLEEIYDREQNDDSPEAAQKQLWPIMYEANSGVYAMAQATKRLAIAPV